jgi:hypothetical protein
MKWDVVSEPFCIHGSHHRTDLPERRSTRGTSAFRSARFVIGSAAAEATYGVAGRSVHLETLKTCEI